MFRVRCNLCTVNPEAIMTAMDGLVPEGGWTAALLEAELRRAMRALQALRVPGLWPAQYKSGMPDVLRDVEDLRYADAGEGLRFRPGAREIARMDLVLSWVLLIPASRPEVRRAVALRSLNHPLSERPVLSWRRIGELLGCHHSQAERWFDKGIAHMTVALARPGLCGAAGGCVPGRAEMDAAMRRVMARPRARRLEVA